MGDKGTREMHQIMGSLPYVKQERRNKGIRDTFLQS